MNCISNLMKAVTQKNLFDWFRQKLCISYMANHLRAHTVDVFF